jgi:hypothetical protein
MTYEVPGYSPREELDRKVITTLEWMIASHQRGGLSDVQLSVAADALFMATAGLVDKDFMEMISGVQELVVDMPTPSIRRHFVNDDKTLSLSWKIGDDEFVITKYEYGQATYGRTSKHESALIARDCMGKFASGLIEKGWTEI